MDEAVYDSVDNLIIGVRGGRVYRCNPITGEVSSQADYSPLAFGRATCCYDAGVNRVFATSFNIGHFNSSNFSSDKNIYSINPTTNPPSVAQVIPFAATFGATLNYAAAESGIARLRAAGGNVYGYGWTGAIHPTLTMFRFQALGIGGPVLATQNLVGCYPSFAQAVIGGDDTVMWADQDACDLESWGFTSSTGSNVALDNTKSRIAVEYAPVQGHLFVTDEFQFIYVYNLAGALLATVNTGRSGFNGVDIKLNPNDGLIYVAGGADNTIAIINPATNLLVGAVLGGYDLPCGFVFTPTVKFAVQQGSVPLKVIP